jgi:hypothetical protein
MAFYLRKSVRLGPMRLNLSKSGLGLSGGVTGARLGVNSRGRTYVHGGRHGLYYRKHLSGKGVNTRQEEGSGCGMLLLVCLLGGGGLLGVALIIEHPWILAAGLIAAAVYGGVRLLKRHRISGCKKELDRMLVNVNLAPESAEVTRLAAACVGAGLPATLRMDIYEAVLDRVLDDKCITDDEQARLEAAREILNLDTDRLQTLHRELFLSAWLKVIDDNRITREETDWIEQLLEGLALSREELRRELEFVNELIEAQQLEPPLSTVEPGEDAAHLQSNETLHVRRPAQVLSRRGRGENISWRVHRDGTLLLTQKRLLVVGGGTTQLRLEDITDIEVNFDGGLLLLHKRGIGRPTWIKTDRPFLLGRRIELLQELEPVQKAICG